MNQGLPSEVNVYVGYDSKRGDTHSRSKLTPERIVENMKKEPVSTHFIHTGISLSMGLGNQMFILASVYGMARANHMQLVVDPVTTDLHRVFDIDPKYFAAYNRSMHFERINERFPGTFDGKFMNLPRGKNVAAVRRDFVFFAKSFH